MTNHLRNNKGFADIIVMGAVLAVVSVASALFIPTKTETPKVINQGIESAPSTVTVTETK